MTADFSPPANNEPHSPNLFVEPLSYRIHGGDGQAYLGNTPLSQLAAHHGTPLYVLDGATVKAAAHAYQHTLENHYPGEHLVLYAAKANLNIGLAQKIGQLGLGLDVVSGGELYTALQAGFPPEKICFNGNNKSADELLMALHHRIGRITVDNLDELALLHELAASSGRTADDRVPILVRITPGIECHTHDYIQTGQNDSKFGVDLSELPTLVHQLTTEYADTIELKGLHAHIGSQIFERQPYIDSAKLLLNIYANIRKHHADIVLTDLNLGGGMGIAYTKGDDPLPIPATLGFIATIVADYCELIDYPLPRLLVEPGRSLMATAGLTLYTVGSQKTVPNTRHYVAVDGGMGDNIRPALYGAEYHAVVANKASEAHTLSGTHPARIVGKYCESGDVVIPEAKLPANVTRGDILAVFGTGAYNDSMASTYNRVPRPATIWVEGDAIIPLVRRETYDDLLARDIPLK